MQVANTLNNSIRILFNPRVESFKLFDFLVVKSDDNRYIAQVVEIYDDKFDASQNVAKLKLFYRITENNEVMPYDNFTPNKECEISKVKPEEIEAFINQDKETFILGTNVKNLCGLNVQYDFFNKNVIVLADKVENANALTCNLAKKLSPKRNFIIIDTTGILELEGATKIKANKNFKMPLNYTTIDYVFERCLYDASLEFQAIGGEIINEIKKFARRQENDFIPFNLLTRVLIQQHKATPYPELKLLLTRLKKYQMDEVFAKTKTEKEALFKSIDKNSITIIDLSDLDTYWQKTYLEYIITDIEKEVYLSVRINDELSDIELINKIYNKKRNINFIPNVSYNYKKLPTIMQYCKNYVLMPSLTQRTDFLDANFALANLITDGCIIFGENTDNFLYLVRDYELEIQEKRKNYRKIALTMVQQDAQQNLGEKGDYFENKEMTDSARLIKELSEFEANQKLKAQKQEYNTDSQETFEEIEDPNTTTSCQEDSQATETQETEAIEEAEEDLIFAKEKVAEETFETDSIEENIEKIDEIKEENEEIPQTEPEQANKEEKVNFEELIQEEIVQENTDEITVFDTQELLVDETNENQEQEIDLSDEELDFFQMAQDSENMYNQAEENQEDDVDLNEIADTSLDNSFEEIINTKNEQPAQSIAIDDKTQIAADILNQDEQKENLPIFKDEEKTNEENITYIVGNVIHHKKYGRGTIVKTIKYENRQLLQIEFEEAGKKLLDPKVADIKLEQ